MAISFVGAGTQWVDSSGGHANNYVNLPTGLQAGDIVIAQLVFRYPTLNGTLTVNTPTGWTLIDDYTDTLGGYIRQLLYWYVAVGGGSDPSQVDFTTSPNTGNPVSSMSGAWRGVSTTSPIAVVGTTAEGQVQGDGTQQPISPSVSATANWGIIPLVSVYDSNFNITGPGLTSCWDEFSSSATQTVPGEASEWELVSSSGTVGPFDWTGVTNYYYWLASTIGLTPSSAGHSQSVVATARSFTSADQRSVNKLMQTTLDYIKDFSRTDFPYLWPQIQPNAILTTVKQLGTTVYTQTVTAASSFTGIIRRAVAYHLTGAASRSWTATLAHGQAFIQALTAVRGWTSSASFSIAKHVLGAASWTVRLTRRFSYRVTASVTTTANILKGQFRGLTATAAFSASLLAPNLNRVVTQLVTGTVAFQSVVIKDIRKNLQAVRSFSATMLGLLRYVLGIIFKQQTTPYMVTVLASTTPYSITVIESVG